MANSQNGWPALGADSGLLHTWTIKTRSGDVTRLRLRNGSAGFVLCHFLLWLAEVVEPLAGKILDDWGWAFRPVRGDDDLSNHASGTAADANATKHPLGRVGTFAQAARIRLRLKLYRGVIRWGGDYHGRKDEMHVEINAPMPAVEWVARLLMKTPRGRRLLADNPGQAAVIRS